MIGYCPNAPEKLTAFDVDYDNDDNVGKWLDIRPRTVDEDWRKILKIRR